MILEIDFEEDVRARQYICWAGDELVFRAKTAQEASDFMVEKYPGVPVNWNADPTSRLPELST